jgi:hypothetical protein
MLTKLSSFSYLGMDRGRHPGVATAACPNTKNQDPMGPKYLAVAKQQAARNVPRSINHNLGTEFFCGTCLRGVGDGDA